MPPIARPLVNSKKKAHQSPYCPISSTDADSWFVLVEKTNLYGTAGWREGFSDEEAAAPHVVPAEPAIAASSAEGYSVIQKAMFFAVIVAVIAVFVRLTGRSGTPEDQGYQKSLA